MSTDNREDYLINILRLTDGTGTVKTTELAHYMDVSPASVTEMLKVLSKEGLVNYARYRGVSLTEEGDRKARDLRRKHHIMERFLTDVLEIDHQEAHDQACAVEHSISEDAANRMCRMIGTKVDGDCTTCQNPCSNSLTNITDCVPVTQLKEGEGGRISHLSSDDPDTIRKLISLGVVPGKELRISSEDSDTVILSIGGGFIALESSLASAVHIDRPVA